MFSSRLHLSAARNSLSLLLERKREAGANILDLTESNPTAVELTYHATLVGAPASSRYEAHAFGLPSAREAVCDYYNGAVSPDQVCLTASTSEAYSFIFKLLCDPGDEVLVPVPSYPLFEFLASLESVRAVAYPLRYQEGWWIDFNALPVSERTKAVVVVNPNNPTGSYLKREEMERFREIGLPLICDEVFRDYALEEDASRICTVAGERDLLTFALSGLSKVCCLPQMKLGWVAVSGPQSHEALHRLEFIADTFLSVGAPVQFAAPELLRQRTFIQDQVRTRCRRNLSYLIQRLPVLRVEGGWYAIVPVPRVRSDEEWALALLRDSHVLVQPGYFYDLPTDGYVVLSLLTPEPVFRDGVDRVASAVTDTIVGDEISQGPVG